MRIPQTLLSLLLLVMADNSNLLRNPEGVKQVSEHLSSQSKKVKNWCNMVIDPQAKAVHAPRTLPGISCVSKLVKSVDIPYSDTNSGYVTVAISPKATAAYMQSSTGDYPSAGRDRIYGKTTEATPLHIEKNQAVPRKGMLVFSSGNALAEATASWIRDLDEYFPALSGWSGVSWDAGQNLYVDLAFRSPIATYVRPYCVSASGTKVDSTQVYLPPGAWVTTQIQTPGAGSANQFIGFYTCDQNGAQISLEAPTNIDFSINGTAQVMGTQASPASVVRSELLDQAGVSHVAGTSCHLLVTNLASEFDGAGEIVIARTHASIMSSGSTQEIMSAIKALPEKNYWRSGNLLRGGYAWYLPDDAHSYEPKGLHEDHSDNILVAAIKMAKDAGQVRVNCTWTFEYYTPAQVISRSPGIPWTDESKEMYTMLLSRPAVSENPGHAALIAALAAGATAVHTFYKENSGWIDPLAKEAAKAVVKKVVAPKKKSAPRVVASAPRSRPQPKR